MKKFSCRGREKREQLLRELDIIPYSHTILLNGQVKHSAAEDEITKEYYSFLYRKKNSNDKEETFDVGNYAARHFFELLKLDPFPLFNPLKSYENKQMEKCSKLLPKQSVQWNPLAKELYEAIYIIQIVWNKSLKVFADIIIKILKNKNEEPPLKYIKSVNTTISKDYNNRNIYNMLDYLRKNNKIKEYEFPFIDKILIENGIKNYITGNGT